MNICTKYLLMGLWPSLEGGVIGNTDNPFSYQFPTDFQSVLPSSSISDFVFCSAGGHVWFHIPLKFQTWVLAMGSKVEQVSELVLVQRCISLFILGKVKST
jgi:hypothetical protein